MAEVEEGKDGKSNENNRSSEGVDDKKILASCISGKVKWFDVGRGYGFICRDDGQPDVFVHHTAITKYNLRHQISSLDDDEVVNFDVVEGKRGLEAANVTGPNGDRVHGSRFASNMYAGIYRARIFGQRRGYGGRRDYNSNKRGGRKSEADGDQVVDEKRMAEDKENISNKKNTGPKKYSESRVSRVDGGHRKSGGLKRSCSLPADLDRCVRQMKGIRREAYFRLRKQCRRKMNVINKANGKIKDKQDGNTESKIDKTEIEAEGKGDMTVESSEGDVKAKPGGKKSAGKRKRNQRKMGGAISGRDTDESKKITNGKESDDRSGEIDEGAGENKKGKRYRNDSSGRGNIRGIGYLRGGGRRGGYRRMAGRRKSSTKDVGADGDAKNKENGETKDKNIGESGDAENVGGNEVVKDIGENGNAKKVGDNE